MKRLLSTWFSLVVTCLLLVCLEGKVVAQPHSAKASSFAKASEDRTAGREASPPMAAQTAAGGFDCAIADLDGSGQVNTGDLIELILNWHSTDPFYDLNGDGLANGPDLVIIIQCHHYEPPTVQCLNSTTSFQNLPLPSQDGLFTVEFTATPLAEAMDAFVAFSDGPGSDFDDFAAIVRFKGNDAEGIQRQIDVRTGDGYDYEALVEYQVDVTYQFSVEVNLFTKTYSVTVSAAGLPETQLATDYAFRTSQANISTINNAALWGGTGVLQACGYDVESIEPECGDGVIEGEEQCDDDNFLGGDGCSATCEEEPDYNCTGEPSVCVIPPPPQCSDGIDNDGDGQIDLADEGCSSAQDNSEGSEDTPVIANGSGWTGATIEPGPVGAPGEAGHDAKAIAHFDVIPYQTITDDFEFGVAAFHINGIEKVLFAVNQPGNGPNDLSAWTEVTEMTLNPRTNVWEYWAMLKASDLPDGPAEVRAIAYPTVGQPRLLGFNYHLSGGPDVNSGHIPLYANSGGTLPAEVRFVNPGESIAAAAQSIAAAHGGNAGGGTIYLNAGDHVNTLSSSGVTATGRWLTLSGAPGTTRDQVRIVGGDSLYDGLTRCKSLTLWHTGMYGSGGIWAEEVLMQGTSANDNTTLMNSVGQDYVHGTYFTESDARNFMQPMQRVYTHRNNHFHNIGGDVYKNPAGLVVNGYLTDHGFNTEGVHSDLMQWYAGSVDLSIENHIFYNIQSYDADVAVQGIYLDAAANTQYTMNNMAFINFLVDRNAPVVWAASNVQADVSLDHVLIWHVTHDELDFKWYADASPNMSIKGNSWYGVSANSSAYAWEHNNLEYTVAPPWHQSANNDGYYDDTVGLDCTTGDPGYLDRVNNDYHPGPGSQLLNRMEAVVPADAMGNPRDKCTALGALAGLDEGGADLEVPCDPVTQ